MIVRLIGYDIPQNSDHTLDHTKDQTYRWFSHSVTATLFTWAFQPNVGIRLCSILLCVTLHWHDPYSYDTDIAKLVVVIVFVCGAAVLPLADIHGYTKFRKDP